MREGSKMDTYMYVYIYVCASILVVLLYYNRIMVDISFRIIVHHVRKNKTKRKQFRKNRKNEGSVKIYLKCFFFG